MNKKLLWDSILQQAISGKLVPQLDTEPAVEQIGPDPAPDEVPFELPEKWTLVQLSSITTLINGRAYKKAELLEEAPGLTPIIRVGNFFTQSKIYYSDLELAPKHYCNKGDLLFAWSASFGPKIWEGPRSIFHYHIWKIEYNPQYLDCKWLYYWLEERSEALKSSGHGIAMIHITKQEMEKKPIAVPPLEEQRRIVAKLDELKPLIDQFGEAHDKLSELEADFPRKLKASILQAAMQGKLVPQLDTEPAVEQIGPKAAPEEVPFKLPEKWKWVQLEHLNLASFSGGTPTKNNPDYWNGSIPWASIKDLSVDSEELSATQDHITEKGVANSSTKLVEANNIIVGMRMGLDKIAINKIAVAINQDLRALYLDYKLIDPKFFIKFYKTLRFEGTGTTVKGIKKNELMALFVPLPPLEEQRRIVERIEQLFAEVDKMSACKAP